MTQLVMVTWDRLKYTKQAVESVLKQKGDFKLHIVDNGSQDGTVEYLKSLKDPRIEITLWDTNRGLSEATEYVFGRSDADYLGRVDNDVILPEDWLERCVEAHTKYPNFGFIGGFHFFDYHLTDITPKITEYNGIKIWEKPYIGGCSFLIPKAVHDRYGTIQGSGVMGLTDYQEEVGKERINGYLYPFIKVDHLEHANSPGNIKDEEYENYSVRCRNMGAVDYSASFDRDSVYYLKLNQ